MSPTGRVRRARPEDLDAVMAVEEASFWPRGRWSRASWAEELESADHRLCLVATDEGARVVAAASFHGFDVADLDRVMVHPDARRAGLAEALVAEGVAWASARGCHTMMLEVRHDNDPAISLYRRFGMTTVSRRPNYYGGGVDALIMSVDLPPASTTPDPATSEPAASTEENHV